MVSEPGRDVAQRFLDQGVFRHGRALGRIAADDQHVGLFIDRAFADLIEEAHRVGRVGQGDQTGLVQGCQQEAAGDPDALIDVVVLLGLAGLLAPALLGENGNQDGRMLQEGLVRIRAQRGQGFQPLLRRLALIEGPLFGLGGLRKALRLAGSWMIAKCQGW